MSSKALSADDIEEMTRRVLGSRKYASMNLPPETVKDLIQQEITAGKSPKDVEKSIRLSRLIWVIRITRLRKNFS